LSLMKRRKIGVRHGVWLSVSPRELWFGQNPQTMHEDTLRSREIFSRKNSAGTNTNFESDVNFSTVRKIYITRKSHPPTSISYRFLALARGVRPETRQVTTRKGNRSRDASKSLTRCCRKLSEAEARIDAFPLCLGGHLNLSFIDIVQTCV